MPAIITWPTGGCPGTVSSNRRVVAARVRGGPMPMWIAVTSEVPTRPVHGAPFASLVGRRPNAVTMASISSGIGARMTTRRGLGIATACRFARRRADLASGEGLTACRAAGTAQHPARSNAVAPARQVASRSEPGG